MARRMLLQLGGNDVATAYRFRGAGGCLGSLFSCRVLPQAKTPCLNMLNVLSVDVEEYFHPTEVQAHVHQNEWDELPSRIDQQILDILDLFDRKQVKATFFMLGWLAERRPHVARSIIAAGHEIGCHSYAHQLITT
jgi:hypothetical protein